MCGPRPGQFLLTVSSLASIHICTNFSQAVIKFKLDTSGILHSNLEIVEKLELNMSKDFLTTGTIWPYNGPTSWASELLVTERRLPGKSHNSWQRGLEDLWESGAMFCWKPNRRASPSTKKLRNPRRLTRSVGLNLCKLFVGPILSLELGSS